MARSNKRKKPKEQEVHITREMAIEVLRSCQCWHCDSWDHDKMTTTILLFLVAGEPVNGDIDGELHAYFEKYPQFWDDLKGQTNLFMMGMTDEIVLKIIDGASPPKADYESQMKEEAKALLDQMSDLVIKYAKLENRSERLAQRDVGALRSVTEITKTLAIACTDAVGVKLDWEKRN